MKKMFVAMVVCLVVSGVQAAYPYLAWNAGMSSAESSNLGNGYPASTAFDSTFGALGYRSDWSYAQGTSVGDAGFQLRTDGHGMWHSNVAGSYTSPAGVACQEWLLADFGSAQTIYGADVWNIDTFYHGRGVKDVSISVSADGVSWATAWAGTVARADGTLPTLMYDGVTWVNPNLQPGHAPQYGRLFDTRADFGGAVSAQYVVINIANNWEDNYGDYIALDEVRFLAIPEPATLSMLGLGIVAFLRKRK